MSVFDYDDLTYYRTQYEKLMSERDRLRAQVELLERQSKNDLRAFRATIAEQARRIERLERTLNSPYEVRLRWAEVRIAQLEQALRELVRAASDTANEHGCSGDLGARLSDARTALKQAAPGEGVGQ